MRLLANIIWLILGGLKLALVYLVTGLLLCATIVGIPFGLQVIKLGGLALTPFGQEVYVHESSSEILSIIMNIFWALFAGIWIALRAIAFKHEVTFA